jgi:hypothetical protein
MDRCVGAAATMPGGGRKELAVQALARSATVSDLSIRHGVSRTFVYQQTNKARHALDDAFLRRHGRYGTVRDTGHQAMAAPGGRRTGTDVPQFVSRR